MEVAKTQEQLDQEHAQIVAKKSQAWANFGAAIYNKGLEFQVRAQATINKLITPTSIEEVAAAEAALKVVKSERTALKKDRIEITSRFDDKTSELMESEKSIEVAEKETEAEIISIKSAHQKKELAKQQKESEIKSLRELIGTYINQADFNARTFVNNTVSAAYNHALTIGDIKPEGIAEYLITCKGSKCDLKTFNLAAPIPVLKLITKEEADQIISEEFSWHPESYVTLYHEELDKKFVDYAIAFENKLQALELSQKEEAETQNKIKEEANQKALAASISASSQTLDFKAENVGPVVKDLKQSYAIDMVETADSAIKIMSAFCANFAACNEKLKITKWFAITPAQMGTALAKMKNDDNNFQPAGIIFKVVEKL